MVLSVMGLPDLDQRAKVTLSSDFSELVARFATLRVTFPLRDDLGPLNFIFVGTLAVQRIPDSSVLPLTYSIVREPETVLDERILAGVS
jgi:hypothetical protein